MADSDSINDETLKLKSKLIDGVRTRSCLWITTDSLYKDRRARAVLWAELAKQLHLKVPDAKLMWSDLMRYFRLLKKKHSITSHDTSDCHNPKKIQWLFWDQMTFLLCKNERNPTFQFMPNFIDDDFLRGPRSSKSVESEEVNSSECHNSTLQTENFLSVNPNEIVLADEMNIQSRKPAGIEAYQQPRMVYNYRNVRRPNRAAVDKCVTKHYIYKSVTRKKPANGQRKRIYYVAQKHNSNVQAARNSKNRNVNGIGQQSPPPVQLFDEFRPRSDTDKNMEMTDAKLFENSIKMLLELKGLKGPHLRNAASAIQTIHKRLFSDSVSSGLGVSAIEEIKEEIIDD